MITAKLFGCICYNTKATIKHFVQSIEVQYQAHIQAIHTDNGGKFLNAQCTEFLLSKGIAHLLTCPYTPQQNRVAKRKHRHLLDTAHALKFQASLPNLLQSECVLIAAYIINRLPMKMLSWKSPYEGKVHMKCYIKGSLIMIIYKFLVAFVLVSILGQAKTDLLQEQLSLQFVGYSLNRKTYKLYDPHSHTIFVSRDVIFHKSIFLFQSMTTDCVQNVLPCSSEDFTEIIHSFM